MLSAVEGSKNIKKMEFPNNVKYELRDHLDTIIRARNKKTKKGKKKWFCQKKDLINILKKIPIDRSYEQKERFFHNLVLFFLLPSINRVKYWNNHSKFIL